MVQYTSHGEQGCRDNDIASTLFRFETVLYITSVVQFNGLGQQAIVTQATD